MEHSQTAYGNTASQIESYARNMQAVTESTQATTGRVPARRYRVRERLSSIAFWSFVPMAMGVGLSLVGSGLAENIGLGIFAGALVLQILSVGGAFLTFIQKPSYV